MPRTLWTVSAAGLLAFCMTSCGSGGTDYVSEICVKLDACDGLSTLGLVTTLGECKTAAIQGLRPQDGGTARATADVHKALDDCLKMTDCPAFVSCVSAQIPAPTPTEFTCTCSPQPCSCTYRI